MRKSSVPSPASPLPARGKAFLVVLRSWEYNDEYQVLQDGVHPAKIFKARADAERCMYDLAEREFILSIDCEKDLNGFIIDLAPWLRAASRVNLPQALVGDIVESLWYDVEAGSGLQAHTVRMMFKLVGVEIEFAKILEVPVE
jgi:hypothetical protein